MKTIVFCNARDEDGILEWIAHYINLGFTTVYIYDHKSLIPIESLLISRFVVDKTHPRCKVIVKRLDHDIPMMKTTLMREAAMYSKLQGYNWMLYIDADEFLYLKDDKNIQTFLEKYKNVSQIGINSVFFGSNYHSKQPSGGLLQSFLKSDDIPYKCIKPFVIPKDVRYAINPHYYILRAHKKSDHCENKPLNSKDPWIYETQLPLHVIPAYFAHYCYQSYEEYVKRKVRIPRDDNGKFRDLLPAEEIHAKYNTMDNEDLYKKYDSDNKIIIELLKPSEI
ncbi:hypothetical protein EBU71_18575 [bacterium]|nr:hypothetical protein [Candidatus Elulimicrobium humile]